MVMGKTIGILFRDDMIRGLRRPPPDPLCKRVTRRTADRWAKVQPGDLLWVRECWARSTTAGENGSFEVIYRADYQDGYCPGANLRPWRSAMVMPRWASRMTLRVTSVTKEPTWGPPIRELGHERFELLPNVTDAEARLEGVADRAAYLDLWNQINGKKPAPPHVWRIAFDLVETNHGR